MKPADQSKSDRTSDPDFAGAEVALLRAARRARQRANASSVAGAKHVRDVASLSFSQAQGYEELPGLLELEDLSSGVRTQIWNLLYFFLENSTRDGMHGPYLTGAWEKILRKMHCFFDDLALDDWRNGLNWNRTQLREHIEQDSFNRVFDRIQFIMRDRNCPLHFIRDLKRAFEICGLAYTIDSGPPPTIFPVTTSVEGIALIESLQTLRQAGLVASTSHLQSAAQSIKQQDWAGGIRESIHAVESVARKIDPQASRTLGPALESIERQGTLHATLKKAFSTLYGYTSNQQGIRHALLDRGSPDVGLDEAVFMLGACASFASYLWRKHVARGKIQTG